MGASPDHDGLDRRTEGNAAHLARDGTAPLYVQVRQAILDQLALDDVGPGDKLPTERALQERYGVSRATVRNALDLLERQGYVVRTQGVGTVVARAKIEPDISQLTSFTEDITTKGMRAGSTTLEVALVRPPPLAREQFGLTDDDRVWYVQRLRCADGEPVGIHDLYLPPTLEFAPHALQRMASYYALLRERHGIEPVRAVQRFTARTADAHAAALLHVAEGAALLAIQRFTYDACERAIEYVDLIYRADRYEYRVELRRER